MSVDISIKWSGQIIALSLENSVTIGELRQRIFEKTQVRPERQKLLGVKGKDENPLVGNFKPGKPIMMIGSAEKDIQAVQAGAPEDLPEVINDLEDIGEEVSVEQKEEHLNKIKNRVDKLEVVKLNEPRPGSKLLVLDIDYTLFDHRSPAETANQLMRPFLHEFLTEAYHDNYDIVIWSATSMKWIQVKMDQLGVSGNLNYRIAFMLDSKAMISVFAEQYGVVEVKPLGVIWGKFPQWNERNTIMFDDLRRNFLMNPQSGLKIRPFKNALTAGVKDRELKRLARYLKAIAPMDDFTSLDHRHWEKWLRNRKQPREEGDENN